MLFELCSEASEPPGPTGQAPLSTWGFSGVLSIQQGAESGDFGEGQCGHHCPARAGWEGCGVRCAQSLLGLVCEQSWHNRGPGTPGDCNCHSEPALFGLWSLSPQASAEGALSFVSVFCFNHWNLSSAALFWRPEP